MADLTPSPNDVKKKDPYEGYPKVFANCPCCGSAIRIMESLVDRSAMQPMVVLLQNPQKMTLITTTAPAMIVITDICADCGCQYATRVEIVQVPVQVRMQDKQGQALDPTKFGRG